MLECLGKWTNRSIDRRQTNGYPSSIEMYFELYISINDVRSSYIIDLDHAV